MSVPAIAAAPAVPTAPVAEGVQGLVNRYQGYGPLAAAFVTNFLATFGDKGQLAVITLATTYDGKKIFLGAISAFACWNAIEVVVGKALVSVVPTGVMPLLTGGLFLVFGVWSAYQAYQLYVTDRETDGGMVRTVLPGNVFDRVQSHSAYVIAFVMIAVAEVGDKTQLLTINLAAAFPAKPMHVWAGALLGLTLRTGIDAFVGETAERYLPTAAIQAGAAAIFAAVGSFELGVITGTEVVAVAVAAVAFAVAGALKRAYTGEADASN